MSEWMKQLEDKVLDEILKIIEGVAAVVGAAALLLLPTHPLTIAGHKCDCFAAWGPRTVDGNVRASRNLDWTKDTGISAAKIVTVYAKPLLSALQIVTLLVRYHAVESAQHTYATVGFAGFSAALAGAGFMPNIAAKVQC